MTAIGLLMVSVSAAILVVEVLHHKKRKFALYGWIGLALLAIATGLMLLGFTPVAIYFTPIAWTCYILAADAAVLAIRGSSLLHDHRARFWLLAALSIPLWLIFEAYNLRLQNWTYVGVPRQWPLAVLGYGWSFATIWPGIFETAELVESFGWFKPGTSFRFSSASRNLMIALGAICLTLPLVLPQPAARYLFVLVWIGFVLLLDPINYRIGAPSFLGDFVAGRFSRFYSFLISGFICGWLWEFWNYWAAAKWHYIFPMFQRYKIFEMPAPGFLGFLPFAVECFTMYAAARYLFSAPQSAHAQNGSVIE